MKSIRFSKMHALCNDFMVIDATQQELQLTEEKIRTLAHRRSGVGFDQLLIIEKDTDPDFEFSLRIYNSDGGEAEQCGNGTVCVVRFLLDNNLSKKPEVHLRSKGGPIHAETLNKDPKGDLVVKLLLGEPDAIQENIPFLSDVKRLTHDLQLVDESINVISVTPISMGNPHAVVFDIDLTDDRIPQIGQAIQLHESFPESTNVEFVEVVGPHNLNIRIIERGTGETMACGSGACAATAAAQLRGYVKEEVEVSQPGGQALVTWCGVNSPIYLTATASHVYTGELAIG